MILNNIYFKKLIKIALEKSKAIFNGREYIPRLKKDVKLFCSIIDKMNIDYD